MNLPFPAFMNTHVLRARIHHNEIPSGAVHLGHRDDTLRHVDPQSPRVRLDFRLRCALFGVDGPHPGGALTTNADADMQVAVDLGDIAECVERFR